MKYTVIWKKAAERMLAQIWLDSGDRPAVTAASNRIDQLLGHDPETRGESRDQNRRVLFESPLGVAYIVDPQDMKVHILAVWQF